MGFPDLKIPSLETLRSLLTFLSQRRNAVTPGKKIPNISMACCSFQNLKNVTPYKICINKTNDLILNLTPEKVTQHSRIE